jgi:hypothetical protein
MAIVPTTNGSIDVYASHATQLILDISSYFAPEMQQGEEKLFDFPPLLPSPQNCILIS